MKSDWALDRAREFVTVAQGKTFHEEHQFSDWASPVLVQILRKARAEGFKAGQKARKRAVEKRIAAHLQEAKDFEGCFGTRCCALEAVRAECQSLPIEEEP